MKLSVAIGVLAIIILAIQTWKESLPETKIVLKKRLLFASASLLVLASLLNFFDGFIKKKEDDAAKASQRIVQIYEKVDALRIDILNETFSMLPHIVVVESYANFALLDQQQNTGELFKTKWMERAKPDQKQALKEAESSLKRLQNIALQIMNLEETSPKIIPRQLVDWASTTLKINLITIPNYIDPYDRHPESSKYLNNIGVGFTLLKNTIRTNSGYKDLPKL